jgi:hypothetical protein
VAWSAAFDAGLPNPSSKFALTRWQAPPGQPDRLF